MASKSAECFHLVAEKSSAFSVTMHSATIVVLFCIDMQWYTFLCIAFHKKVHTNTLIWYGQDTLFVSLHWSTQWHCFAHSMSELLIFFFKRILKKSRRQNESVCTQMYIQYIGSLWLLYWFTVISLSCKRRDCVQLINPSVARDLINNVLLA